MALFRLEFHGLPHVARSTPSASPRYHRHGAVTGDEAALMETIMAELKGVPWAQPLLRDIEKTVASVART